VIKASKQANGAQRYQCQNEQCVRRIFLLQYQDRGRAPEIRRQVIDMAINGRGIRDTARVLRISPTTVIAILKKSRRALLAPFGLIRDYPDKAGGYRRHLPLEQHTVGKLTMQKIERKHLTLRTRLKRLARKTLCFSRSCVMHDLLIRLYMNRVEFGGAV
jgi:IS1 transposase/InsA C-terminal domain